MTWATSVPILVFLCLSVLDLGPMYATDRQTSDRCRQTKASFNVSALWGRKHNNNEIIYDYYSYFKIALPTELLENRRVKFQSNFMQRTGVLQYFDIKTYYANV